MTVRKGQSGQRVTFVKNFIKFSHLSLLSASAIDVFQFLQTIHFLETSRTNHTAHQLVVATGMTPSYQIFSYHTGYSETGTCTLNPLKPELNPICYLLALLAHHFLHVSRIRVKSLIFRRLMSYIYIYIYIYMEHPFLMFLDHTQRRSTVGRTPLDE